jgi:Cu(I)/Ag(I) efflux system membrane fusion protein
MLLIVAAAAAGYWWGEGGGKLQIPTLGRDHDRSADNHVAAAPSASADTREVLYWYDPMHPQQRFDKPGRSPYMDMELVPKYADESPDAVTVRIDPAIAQNLGVRVADVVEGTMAKQIDAVGTIAFNGRDLTVVQARTGGYVERVYALAPGDVIAAGAALAELLVPEWAGAQSEFLALVRSGDAKLIAAARERLRLLGMPQSLIAHVERSGSPRPVFTVTTPAAGVIDTLDVRMGMTLSAGQTLATVKGIDTVWLDIAVPEAQGAWVKPGDKVATEITAFPGETVTGEVIAVLPAADVETRTFTVRVQIDNRDRRLRPGMFATARITGEGADRALLVPSEAIIRTGKRTLVMLAEAEGHYRPVEIRIGHDSNGKTEVLSGLTTAQRVVVSGQFLIDSEASIAGVMARTSENPQSTAAPLHEAEGTVIKVSEKELKLEHGPFTTLGMPAMTVTYPLARPEIARGIEPGEHIRVGVRDTDAGLVIEKIERKEATP